jgi:hypothetical protein
MGNDEWSLIFHILHHVMNESKHCECKKASVAVKWFFFKWIYSIISFTNLTRVHCMSFAIFRTGDVRHRCTSWWRAGVRVSWKYFFYYFDSFIDSNLLGYYGFTYIWTEIRHYFVILKFSNFSRLKFNSIQFNLLTITKHEAYIICKTTLHTLWTGI